MVFGSLPDPESRIAVDRLSDAVIGDIAELLNE